MEQFDIEKQTKDLQSSTLKAIKGLFPVKTKTGTLRLADVWVDDRLDPGDIQSQLKAKNSDRTWGVPIYGTFELLDASGKVSQRKDKVRLVTLPKPTPRMSYIINGSEHQISNQLRLRPAGYAVRTGPGGIKGQINLSKGYSGQIELHMKPETGVMRTKVGQANQRLYPILNALGLSDGEMARRWGQSVLDANKNISQSDYDLAVRSFAKSLLRKDYSDTESAAQDLRKFILDTEMDPKINQRTLGKPHKTMSAEFLADLGSHVLGTVKGEKEPHDRNALEYKEYRKITDLIEERLSLPEFKNKITRKIQYNIAGKDKIEDMIHPSIIGPDIKAVFNLPELHQRPDQLNPIDMWNTATRVTIMGPGGIQSEHQVTDDMRDVHPSHLGFLDPVHTPEGNSVGYVHHLPFTVTSKDKTLLTRAINVKTNKLERIDPAKFSDSVVAFPGQYDRKSKKWKDPKKVSVLAEGNKTKQVLASKVDYTLESPKQGFSMSSNLIPFLETNSGGRTLVASKMAEQAVPLKEREKPLVQSKVGGDVTFDEMIGDAFVSRSPVDGIVSKTSEEAITIQGTDGQKRKIQLYNNFPLNSKSFISSDLKVKKGDIVSRDQIISDTNFTKDGSMALGKNLVTAYMPYKGYNFEDGIVITDTAAKKLTSEHMYLETAQQSDRFDIHKRRFIANYPNVYTKTQIESIDDDGVVKKGTVVQPGDPVITRLRKDEIDPENLVLGKLSRTLIRPWKDDSISWHGDMPGRVTDVVRYGNKVKVYIKTEEPASIGDKLVGRYGNKGVVGLIVPEGEAPRTKDGTPADIILNPHGIITRINVGQVLENAAAKVAEKTGKTYVTDNFSDKNSTKEVQNALAKNGISDLEELEDPVTGKSLGKVNVGKTYIMKLKKQVRSQFSARGAGPGWRYSQHTQEPVKGGEEGSKSMDLLTFYSMLAHGSRCFLGSTPVRLSDGSNIQISDIVKKRLPVRVQAFDGESIVSRNVVAYSVRVADPDELVCICVVTPGMTKRKHRRKIKCTSGHEFFTTNGKIQAGDLSPGDTLFTPGKKLHPAISGLEETRVLEVAPYEPKYYEDYLVYNIEVEKDHNYFANGILVGNSNLREMATYKGTRNDDFWNALKTGSLLPSPKPTFAYNKFLAYMKGAGVDVKQEGSKLTLAPMTDKEIDNLSNGAIKDPQFIRAKDLEEKPGGLMDKKITGGLRGEKWSHIKLNEPIVNPIFEQPVRALLDMNKRTYSGLMEGRLFVDEEGNYNEEGNGATGGKAVEGLLSQVDREEKLKEFTEAAKKARSPSSLNKANHGIRYIEALKRFKLEPKDAYILSKVPILPPVFRPIYALPDGNLHTSPVNYLYRDLGLANQKLQFMNSLEYMPESAKQELRRDIYKGTAAIQGLAKPITFYPKSRPVRGIIEEIKGVQGAGSKTGFFQKHVLRREQDLVGRGTIIPEPKLGIDEVGLPEEMAWTVFRPFVIRELVSQGYKAVDADKQVDERSLIAQKTLDVVMNDRPVLLNRAPSLHKFSIMALKPKIMAGRAIKIPPLIVKGFNADHDGNCVTSLTKVTLTLEPNCGTKSPSEIEKEIEMKFGARSKVIGTTRGGVVFETDIGDFPYIKGNPKIDKNGAETYGVQNGISVLSIDKETWKPSFEKVTGFTVDRQHSVVDVKTRRGYGVSVSDNESLCVYNHETGDLEKRKPSESVGMFCPVVKRIPSLGEKYDYETGWMVGAFASDGFFMGDRENVIGYSKKSTESRNRFADAVSNFEGGPIKRKTYKNFHDATKDIQGESIKDHLTIDKSVHVFKSCYHESIDRRSKKERASLYKKLPDISQFSEDALLGVFSGLLDGDGTLSWSNGKSKPQLVANIGTSSPYLAESVKSLCRLLGVRFSQSQYGPKEGRLQKHVAYLISLSIVDIYKISSKLRLIGKKKVILEEFIKSEVLRDDRDVVPVPFQIIQRFASRMHPAFKKDTKLIKSLISIKSSRKPPYISRPMAKRMLPHLECENSTDKEWEKIVLEEDTMWDAVVSIDGERTEDVYDFVVPSSKIFAVNDGLVVYDTMHVHVPIMPKAVTEAKGMLPSKHLFNPGTGNIMVAPSQEAAIGLYFLTQDGKSIKKSFSAVGPLKEALDKKEIDISDMVTLAGKKTSAGRAMVDAVLPEKYQGRNQVLDKKGVSSLLTEIAKNDPNDYAKTVHALAELGNEYAYNRGVTVSIDDVQPDLPEKDALFAEAKKQAEKLDDAGIINLYSEVDKKAKKIIAKRLGEQENSLYQMVRSGARGNMDQLKQIVSAPLLFEDVHGDPLPIPVESSFSKGLSMGEYWNSMYGARKGSVDAKLQTAKPGEFNKDLMATTVKNVITEEDCGTDKGVEFTIDDVEAQDRILTSDIQVGSATVAKAGDIITSNMMSKLRSGNVKKVKARSPLTCTLPRGTCAKCYGLDADGRLHAVGDNLGAIAGQSLTEPLTQMVLRSRHHGGVAGGQQLTGYEKIDKLVHMPKTIMGKATLAERSGKISNIEEAPAGGKNIFIDDTKHFVSPQNVLKVRLGTKLKKGDPLSDGIIHPRELVRLKGMESAQNYLVDEISNAYRDTGVNLKRKNIEAVVRSIADTTRVLDGGDSPWLFGDTVSHNAAEAFNRSALGRVPLMEAEGKPLFKDHGPVKAGTKVGKRVSKILEGLGYNEVSVGPDPIIHEPFLDGIKQLPMLNRDWMAQMGYGHLVRGIKEGAGEAWETDIHDYSPVPAFAYGAEFGLGGKGKY